MSWKNWIRVLHYSTFRWLQSISMNSIKISVNLWSGTFFHLFNSFAFFVVKRQFCKKKIEKKIFGYFFVFWLLNYYFDINKTCFDFFLIVFSNFTESRYNWFYHPHLPQIVVHNLNAWNENYFWFHTQATRYSLFALTDLACSHLLLCNLHRFHFFLHNIATTKTTTAAKMWLYVNFRCTFEPYTGIKTYRTEALVWVIFI